MHRIILGIDPGTIVIGYGIIEILNNKISVLKCQSIHLGNISCQDNSYNKQDNSLKTIFYGVKDIINSYNPTEVAMESPFYFRNVQSTIKLGRIKGLILGAIEWKIPLVEYAPRKIKQSITGHGNASKEQVKDRIASELGFKFEKEQLYDGSDAVAIALCHYHSTNRSTIKDKQGSIKSKNSWKSFVLNNEGRLKN